ncbi:MAG: prenyltransferase [Defluviitaleaceae bacterium]|nr:prenyltransferase [Defluviitaleaceae bacterium]
MHQNDIDLILSKRHINGGDYWATVDGRLGKGSPFSTYCAGIMLLELGMLPNDPILQQVAKMFFAIWMEDGRFKLYPTGGIYPCQTAYATNLLCRMGYVNDERIQKTLHHFLDTTYTDGGWRCNKFSFCRGPETEYSNPMPTLNILDAFRYSDYLNKESKLDNAVEFLLMHWEIKKPIGPCQYGIGSRFMQIELPLWNYNLLYYVYVLSFYNKAKQDERFLEALNALTNKLVDDKIIVERHSPKLKGFNFCEKGKPSELATKYYNEIIERKNL